MIKRTIFASTLSVFALTAGAQASEDWSWRIVPYVLGPSIDGDAGLGRLDSLEVAVDPVDIIEVLSLGGMIFAEGLHRSGWGFMLDYSFMDLEDDGSFANGAGRADAEIFQGTFNAFAYRRVIDDPDRKLDVYGGIRWWKTTVDVDARIGDLSRSAKVEEDWVDPHLGLRYRQGFGNGDWSFLAQGDIGGFGVSSDFAWTAEAGVAWKVTDTFSLEFTYKAVGVDYETGNKGTSDYFAYDTTTHGPKIGFAFEF